MQRYGLRSTNSQQHQGLCILAISLRFRRLAADDDQQRDQRDIDALTRLDPLEAAYCTPPTYKMLSKELAVCIVTPISIHWAFRTSIWIMLRS